MDTGVFEGSMKPKEPVKKEKELETLKNAIIFLNERKKVLNFFAKGIFSKGKWIQGKEPPSISAHIAKVSDSKQLNILTPKQMFQRLPVALPYEF